MSHKPDNFHSSFILWNTPVAHSNKKIVLLPQTHELPGSPRVSGQQILRIGLLFLCYCRFFLFPTAPTLQQSCHRRYYVHTWGGAFQRTLIFLDKMQSKTKLLIEQTTLESNIFLWHICCSLLSLFQHSSTSDDQCSVDGGLLCIPDLTKKTIYATQRPVFHQGFYSPVIQTDSSLSFCISRISRLCNFPSEHDCPFCPWAGAVTKPSRR